MSFICVEQSNFKGIKKEISLSLLRTMYDSRPLHEHANYLSLFWLRMYFHLILVLLDQIRLLPFLKQDGRTSGQASACLHGWSNASQMFCSYPRETKWWCDAHHLLIIMGVQAFVKGRYRWNADFGNILPGSGCQALGSPQGWQLGGHIWPCKVALILLSPGSSTETWSSAHSPPRTFVAFEAFKKTSVPKATGGEGDTKSTEKDLKEGEDRTPEKLIWPQVIC